MSDPPQRLRATDLHARLEEVSRYYESTRAERITAGPFRRWRLRKQLRAIAREKASLERRLNHWR